MEKEMLESIKKQFTFYKILGEKTFEQLSESQIFQISDEHSNSIAIIVKHIAGNMKSRFTNFLTEDGEKEWRQREDEFIIQKEDYQELINEWHEAWDCLFKALEEVTSLSTLVYIRNEGHTAFEALLRQVTHYAYHVGQIVWLAKNIKGQEWSSLSIPKGGTNVYNQAKFSVPKKKNHFLDNYFEEKD